MNLSYHDAVEKNIEHVADEHGSMTIDAIRLGWTCNCWEEDERNFRWSHSRWFERVTEIWREWIQIKGESKEEFRRDVGSPSSLKEGKLRASLMVSLFLRFFMYVSTDDSADKITTITHASSTSPSAEHFPLQSFTNHFATIHLPTYPRTRNNERLHSIWTYWQFLSSLQQQIRIIRSKYLLFDLVVGDPERSRLPSLAFFRLQAAPVLELEYWMLASRLRDTVQFCSVYHQHSLFPWTGPTRIPWQRSHTTIRGLFRW